MVKQTGQVAYEAYCESTGGVSLVSGDKLPEWDLLKDAIKKAWRDAADAVLMIADSLEGVSLTDPSSKFKK